MQITMVGNASQLTNTLRENLQQKWPQAEVVSLGTVAECLTTAREKAPDLVLLVTEAPDSTLIDWVTDIREVSDAPLVILGRHEREEVITALELGADVYVKQPCSIREIMARITALLRLVGKIPGISDGLVIGVTQLA